MRASERSAHSHLLALPTDDDDDEVWKTMLWFYSQIIAINRFCTWEYHDRSWILMKRRRFSALISLILAPALVEWAFGIPFLFNNASLVWYPTLPTHGSRREVTFKFVIRAKLNWYIYICEELDRSSHCRVFPLPQINLEIDQIIHPRIVVLLLKITWTRVWFFFAQFSWIHKENMRELGKALLVNRLVGWIRAR